MVAVGSGSRGRVAEAVLRMQLAPDFVDGFFDGAILKGREVCAAGCGRGHRQGVILHLAAAVWAVQHIHDQVKDHALEVAAAATGGAHLPTFKDRSIEKAIDEIGGELHSQYTLSYTPSGTGADGYHEIKVSVLRNDAKNLRVRARPGYYVGSPESD